MEVTFQNTMPFEYSITEYCSVNYEGRDYNLVVNINGGSGYEEEPEFEVNILEHGLGDEEIERVSEVVLSKFERYKLQRSC